MENNAVRRFLLVLGALAIVATSFFVTLQILKFSDTPPAPPTPPAPLTPLQAKDAVRVQQVRTIKAALEKYKADHGSYPVLPENDASDLQRDLVGGGYLTEMPKSPGPAGAKNGPLYSSNGKVFGLLVSLEAGAPGIPAGGGCLARADGDHSSKFWGNLPDCPF